MPSADELDAVTVDAAGTIIELVDPTEPLRDRLAARGVARSAAAVAEAFAVEVAHYVPRSHEGRDEENLEELRRECVAVFLGELEADLDPKSFVPDFIASIEFRAIAGVAEALVALQAAGLELACVANWDADLQRHLEHVGLATRFTTVVSSAEAGMRKPDPAPFRLALERLGVEPARALHIGDDEVDRAGARAAGLVFEPTPLATLPERLSLGGTS